MQSTATKNLYNLGEGGIAIDRGDRKTLESSGHECVTTTGRLYRSYHTAVSVSGVGQLVTHNLIHDDPHNEIQLGDNEHRINSTKSTTSVCGQIHPT